MTQKDPIWPVRELIGYRRRLPAAAVPIASGASTIEPLERRSMISGPMAIALAASIAPVSETYLGFDANDDFESPDGTVAALADNDQASVAAFLDHPGDGCEDSALKCRPEITPNQQQRTPSGPEIPRTYTLATIHMPISHDMGHLKKGHREIAVDNRRHAQQPDLALQILASGVAIDVDQAAEVSALLNHQMVLPGIVFNPVAGIAALVA